ncbi:hypothetical protein P7C70_g460, partial [Phenoliferia sp. Uapishka_3]
AIPPTTLASRLPAETIFAILSLSIPTRLLSASSDNPSDTRKRYKTLKSCALVCKSWRTPACTLLWRHVALVRRSRLTSWIDSPALGKYQIWSLEITGKLAWADAEEILGEDVGDVVERLEDGGGDFGLRSLSLGMFEGGVPKSVWESKAISSIKHLSILSGTDLLAPSWAAQQEEAKLWSTISPSFQLTTLRVDACTKPMFETLLLSSQATLKALRIPLYSLEGTHYPPEFGQYLHLISETLEELVLYHSLPTTSTPFLKSLVNLRTIDLRPVAPYHPLTNEEIRTFLKWAPGSLRKLILHKESNAWTAAWRKEMEWAKRRRLPCMKGLKRVEIWAHTKWGPDVEWAKELGEVGIEAEVLCY